jgi:hypothetical protein
MSQQNLTVSKKTVRDEFQSGLPRIAIASYPLSLNSNLHERHKLISRATSKQASNAVLNADLHRMDKIDAHRLVDRYMVQAF